MKIYLHIIGFGNLDKQKSDSIIQWSKFLNLFNNIKIILSASIRNIIILDRTPYSENIWNQFFNRTNPYQNDIILKTFLSNFTTLNEEIQFVSLDVNTTILADRILVSENDRINYINAFNNLYKNISSVSDDDHSKILFMVNKIKEEFNKLYITLRQYNIDVITYENNTIDSINFITNNIVNKIIK